MTLIPQNLGWLVAIVTGVVVTVAGVSVVAASRALSREVAGEVSAAQLQRPQAQIDAIGKRQHGLELRVYSMEVDNAYIRRDVDYTAELLEQRFGGGKRKPVQLPDPPPPPDTLKPPLGGTPR